MDKGPRPYHTGRFTDAKDARATADRKAAQHSGRAGDGRSHRARSSVHALRRAQAAEAVHEGGDSGGG